MSMSWKRCLWGVGLWLSLCVAWSCAASAQTISFSLGFPSRGIKDRAHFRRTLHKQIRVHLVRNGFGTARGVVRKGFHLKIRASVEEEIGDDDPANCAITVDAKVIMMPQRRMVAHDVSASGSGKYTRAAKMTKPRLRKLRLIAARSVAGYLGRNLRGLFRQIQSKLKTLKKGQVLGVKVRSLSSGGRRGSGKGKDRTGKPLPGRPPKFKLIPASVDPARARPTLSTSK